jgi:hypothetical protein
VKNKITLCIFLLTLFSLMNLYSRTLRHIDIKDVKQKHHQKLIEKKIKEEQRKEEEKYIQSVMEDKRYNWRKKLNEQMTTSDVFYTNLPATGDINLAYPEWNELAGYNYNISDGTLTITNSGVPGPESGIAASFDTSLYDTLVIDAKFSGNTILGVFAGDSFDPILVATSSGTYTISVPQSKNQILFFVSPTLSVGTITINNLRFQRRTPINVFVPLDSPEATSFIRSDPNMSDLSPQERLKKLKEMLDASDEYVEKILGSNFPGTGAARPGEAGDTPGVKVSDFDVSKIEKDYGEVAGSMNTPSSAIKFMQDLMKDGFGGNEVRTNVNGQRMTGRPAEIIQQIKLNFPGGV